MADSLAVVPQLTAVLEHRKASSSCCGALLSPSAVPGAFACQGCGKPCERVLGDPMVITAHGGPGDMTAGRGRLRSALARFLPSAARRRAAVPPASSEETSHG